MKMRLDSSSSSFMGISLIIGLRLVTLLGFGFGSGFVKAAGTITTNVTDESALLAFKSHLQLEPNHPLALNWTKSAPFCNWLGVSCSRGRRPRVVALNLSRMSIEGTVSPFLGNLSFLTNLNLPNNSFRGELPETLGLLRRLKVINFRYNQLSGRIPSTLSQCQRLQQIILESNHFQGDIPQRLGNLQHLQVLHLYQNSLTGQIPLSILNLSSLRVLDIQENNITGGIPTSLCNNLGKLELLYLSDNPLGGPFPASLCRCTRLREIYLVQNYVNGSIPNDIGCLYSLEHLSLPRNRLTGIVPPSMGNLTRLVFLQLIDNYLSGGIPQELGKLSQLRYIRIAFNKLTGGMPQSIFNLSYVQTISFMNNRLSGIIPEVTKPQLQNLHYLILQSNGFTGRIPNFISNASRLILLELSNNSFSGPVPETLGTLLNLETLNLQNNQLTNDPSKTKLEFLSSLSKCTKLQNLVIGLNQLRGELPDSIGNLSKSLVLFSGEGAQIKGRIPSSVGNISNLGVLELTHNELVGTIPSSLVKLHRLQKLRLFRNRLHESIPNELCGLTTLGELFLNENNLSGPLPGCIGNLSKLQFIDFSSNELTSVPPPGLWKLTDLWYLSLSNNLLTGNLTPSVGDLERLAFLNLANNKLSGTIPKQISGMKQLFELNLSNNAFFGEIPSTIGDMGSLEYLNLSMNKLSGKIPDSLNKLQYLKQLNLSFNLLSGQVPTGGVLDNFSVESFVGNDKLCGGVSRLGLPACKSGSNSRRQRILTLLTYVLPLTASAVIAFVSVIVLIRYRRNNRKEVTVTQPHDLSMRIEPNHISYYEVLDATNNFDQENLLGSGGFGSVYKGTLRDGRIVAVKVFDLQDDNALRSFDTECEVMRNIRHRNLVKVITVCSNLDLRSLVLEYMCNGSLDMILHHSGGCKLNLQQRKEITMDVALAMEYLHHGYSEAIVHCDLKPSNILLDENMVARVSDFGIAKVLAKYKSTTQTKTLGTIDYIAPEFGSGGRVSTKGDVYSYGILLMEMFTCKQPTDEIFSEGRNLRDYVKSAFPNLVTELIDPALLKTSEEEKEQTDARRRRREHEEQCFFYIMELALHCTEDLPEQRPTMNEVVVRLSKITSSNGFLKNTNLKM